MEKARIWTVGFTSTCAIAAVAGVLGGLTVLPLLPGGSAHAAADQPPGIEVKAPYGGYRVNSSGLTFGSSADAPFVGRQPDLVLVEMPGGGTAYVYQRDLAALDGPTPATPAEAVARQQRGFEQASSRATLGVPAYLQDGKTRAGTWFGLDAVDPSTVEQIVLSPGQS